MVKEAVAKVERPMIACLGLTYKGDVDDIRESPAIKVIELLRAEGFLLQAYDPFVPIGAIPEQVPTVEAALSGADAILILTDHTAFRELHLDNAKCPVIDPRNVLAIDSQARSAILWKGNR
jgi:UDP-N-acetyl-D-mannosaminuronic acid dehydrogenase